MPRQTDFGHSREQRDSSIVAARPLARRRQLQAVLPGPFWQGRNAMKLRPIQAALVEETRRLIRELVQEVTLDFATKSRNPGVQLDMAGDLEAQAWALRQDFARRAGR